MQEINTMPNENGGVSCWFVLAAKRWPNFVITGDGQWVCVDLSTGVAHLFERPQSARNFLLQRPHGGSLHMLEVTPTITCWEKDDYDGPNL
jgi:hypothetical protein